MRTFSKVVLYTFSATVLAVCLLAITASYAQATTVSQKNVNKSGGHWIHTKSCGHKKPKHKHSKKCKHNKKKAVKRPVARSNARANAQTNSAAVSNSNSRSNATARQDQRQVQAQSTRSANDNASNATNTGGDVSVDAADRSSSYSSYKVDAALIPAMVLVNACQDGSALGTEKFNISLVRANRVCQLTQMGQLHLQVATSMQCDATEAGYAKNSSGAAYAVAECKRAQAEYYHKADEFFFEAGREVTRNGVVKKLWRAIW